MGFPLGLQDADRPDAPARVPVPSRIEQGGGWGRRQQIELPVTDSPDPVGDPPSGSSRWARWIAVAAGCGYSPVAPGTVGSLLGVLLFAAGVAALSPGVIAGGEPLFEQLPGLAWFAGGAAFVPDGAASFRGAAAWTGFGLALFAVFLIGVWASGEAEVGFGRHDDGRIVIDEVVGQWVALAPLVPLGPVLVATGNFLLFFWLLVTGFVLFRLFDVWKPGAIGFVERRLGGGLGVMADDVVAGLHAAILLAIILRFAPLGRSDASSAGEVAREAVLGGLAGFGRVLA